MRNALFCLLALLVLIPLPVAASETPVPAHVVQAVIDDSKLQPFFHFEDSARSPLKVVVSVRESNPSLSASGQPVVVIPPGTPLPGPHLRISGFELVRDVAIVRVEYKVEGVEGRFIFTKSSNSTWQLRVSNVWERSAGATP